MSNVRDHQRTQPAIRFKGFTDVWEKRKLGEVADFFDGQRIPIESGTRQRGKYPYYGATGIIDYVQDYIFDGEYVLLAEDGANITMRTSPLTYITSGKFWLNNHAHVMRSREGSNNFLQSTLENINYEKFNSGTAQPKLNAKTVKSLVILLPSVEEQTKIGVFFQRLDHLIAVNQRKGDVLQNLKKGLLQRLFASETSPIPDIRFKGFTDAWEKRKLGEVATITMGQSPDSKNYTLNPQDHILVQGNADIKNGWVEPRVWTTQITKIAKKGSVLLSVRAPVGEVSKTAFDVVLGRGVASVGQTDFLYQYLITLKINGFWLRYSTGSTFDSINSADIKDAIIFLPEKNEQSRIAKTLNCIDNLIAATQRKGEVLKNLKKALLQKMFV